MDGIDRAADRAARSCRSNKGYQDNLAQHRHIALRSDRKTAEQDGKLLFRRRLDEPRARELSKREQCEGAAAADQSAFQPQSQEMPLEMPGNETVLGADEM